MTEHIEKTIAEAEAKLAEQQEAVRETMRLINQLLGFAGQPPKYQDAEQEKEAATLTFQGDEFYGKVQNTAAREALDRRKALGLGPATQEEIYADLVAGGYRFGAKSEAIARRGLGQMLSKNSSVFERLPNGKYGLASWYGGPKKARKRERISEEAKERLEAEEADSGEDSGNGPEETEEEMFPPE